MASGLAALCVLLTASLSHAVSNGDVRLVNGPSTNKGRVEVYYNGQWGTVCDDSWNVQDGDTVCRQLGYDGADYVRFRAFFGEGTGPIWIDQIHCEHDAQSILDCRHRGWANHDCKHQEDAGVECRRKVPVKPSSLPVRLSCPEYSSCGSCKVCADKKFPGTTDCLPQTAVEGIVEVFYKDEWHPVSSDGWDMNSAKVACGELGYPLAMATPTVEDLWCNWNEECVGSGDGLVGTTDKECTSVGEFRSRMNTTWIKELECVGKESRLLDCYFKEFGPTVSSSMSVATVRCGYAPHPECNINNTNVEIYRTRGSAVPWQGRVEVRIRGEWGTVSDYQWDLSDASVACRALGYGSAKRPTHRSFHGRGVGKIHFNNLKCKGSENLLSECQFRPVRNTNHATDAGVVCNIPERHSCGEVVSTKTALQQDSTGYNYNFVEIHDDSRGWGLLCFNVLDTNAASVICRESAQMFPYRMIKAPHREVNRTRYNGVMVCGGDELSIKDCPRFIYPVARCSEQEAVVDCRPGVPDLVPDLEVFQRSLHYIQRVPMYYLNCAKEEHCLASSAYGKPDSNIRHLLKFSSLTMNYGTADFDPILNREDWLWHTCHLHYHSFEAFIHYDLIDPNTGRKAAEGHKASFCLEDSFCKDSRSLPRYRCSLGIQGISANCGDLYGSHLDCQWIDITDVEPGTYILRQSVNPDRLGLESDYLNNQVECTIRLYPGGYSFSVIRGSCHLSDH